MMAVVSRMRFRELRAPSASMNNIREQTVSRVIEEKIHVAVGKSVKECKSLFVWALQHSGGKRICVLHVHQPAEFIPCMGGKFPASSLTEEEVLAYREIERKEMHQMLEEYLRFCYRMGVQAEKLVIEAESIEQGISELVSRCGIKTLVMGAAKDKSYSRNMREIKSKKAVSVRLQAPAFCHIMFVCKGHLIHQREAISDGTMVVAGSSPWQESPNSETGESNPRRSRSVTLRQQNYARLTNPAQDLFRRVKSDSSHGHEGTERTSRSSNDVAGLLTPQFKSDAGDSSDESNTLLRTSTTKGRSALSTCLSSGMVNVPYLQSGGSECEIGLELNHPVSIVDLHNSSPPSVLDRSLEEPLYDQLEKSMADAANSKREAFEEAVRWAKAEKNAIEAIRKARASENLYAEELKQRKEVEELLAKEKEEFLKMTKERDQVMEELRIALDQKSLLESEVTQLDQMEKDLEQKIISAVDLLQNYKKERDELQIDRDKALKEAEELKKCRAEASGTHIPQYYSEFSFLEIEEGTNKFDPSLKIGEGGYGGIYRGVLRHTEVAIKMLHPHSLQGPSEFQQEVDILSKMRHPNVVTLIGACPEAWALIYEYLPNGSLEDRLSCRDNSPPLSWQTRIRIASELCSVLIFLHSNKPQSIVHGDLKPANILLDSNLVSKLSDFGISRLLSHKEPFSNTTLCCKTNPKGTFAYMDPEFLATGELTPMSDVYSFGIILLRLLTGKSALGITKEVQYALDKGNLKALLDPLAGDWPFVLAEQLTHLALRCCELTRKSRPDLASEVWRVLQPMKASCGGSWSFRFGSAEQCQPPPYFICPIFQEVMRDPHVAADGYTYEAEALRGWLDSGHDTSPMTNIKLERCNLVPNHALRSAIQEWLHQP
ncbi:hypothetical protein K2173_025297 [Erythroxylum novogranatense]|uniref:RING-type E3 ubiquitin transferase n=1 Tax=Erythroxylum novogranatense TaxID=1862640 RepID=A0AAV8UDG3_9ROSI|nr:hypothetical protein K2173_025297 [Erythroxylum novogranatense]